MGRITTEELPDRTDATLDQAAIITDIAIAIHRADSLSASARTVLEKAQQLINADIGAVYLRDEVADLTLIAHQGFPEDSDLVSRTLSPIEGLADQAIATREAVVGQPAARDPLVTGVNPKPRISIVVPLAGRTDVLGIMHLGMNRPVDMGVDLLSLFTAIGTQLGLAVENAQRQFMPPSFHTPLSRDEYPTAPAIATSDHLHPILDSTLDTILIVGQDGTITYANTRLQELTGLESQEAVGESAFQFISEEERPKVRQHWQTVQSGDAQEFETQFQRADGSYATCLLAASPILGTNSHLLVIRDLTEAKNMQAQLIQAEKTAALGRLVAGAAHELNNPLTAVLGFAQILREETKDEAVQADLDRIIRGALRARRIIQDLLAFARQQSPVRSNTDLNQTLEKALEGMARRIQQSKVTLKTDLDPSLPALWANAEQLKLVWDNILSNACQAMAPQDGGVLYVISEQVGDFARVTISDTGPGIPKAHLSKIFDPFFTTKRVGEGVGLGLSLCQGIIESHGGQVWVESTEGEGATFIIELPISAESPFRSA